MSNMGRVNISNELIITALGFPEGTKLENITYEGCGVFCFTLAHEDIPENKEGEIIPLLSPVIEVDYSKRPSTWLSLSWGIE